MRRRWLRRRLFWAGVLLGLVLLFATVSVLRLYEWTRVRGKALSRAGGRRGRREAAPTRADVSSDPLRRIGRPTGTRSIGAGHRNVSALPS